jgi:hypothetical protein
MEGTILILKNVCFSPNNYSSQAFIFKWVFWDIKQNHCSLTSLAELLSLWGSAQIELKEMNLWLLQIGSS